MHEIFEAACQWIAGEGDLESLDNRNYRHSYRGLFDMFANYVVPGLCDEGLDIDAKYVRILSGAIAVYGWMPTIFRGLTMGMQEVVNLLRHALFANPMAVLLSHFGNDEALTFVNGSVIGTSKFLHFLMPAQIPIWDSNVARAMGLLWPYQYANSAAYRSYLLAFSQALAANEITYPDNYAAFCGGNVTAVRKAEQLLFLYGRHLGGA